jgi:hypothetical protein
MSTPFDGITFDGTIRVEAWQDPVGDALGVDPRSAYVEQFWLPVLGPTRMSLTLDVRAQGAKSRLTSCSIPPRSWTARATSSSSPCERAKERDPRSASRESERDRATDAATGSGHQHDLVLEGLRRGSAHAVASSAARISSGSERVV